VAGGRLYIKRYGMVLWLVGECIYSGMECFCGWREIVYTAVWNVIVAAGRLYVQRYGMIMWQGEIVYKAVWNGIVAGGRLNIQRYGMVLWLEGDFIYSGMECYFGWREVVYALVWNGIVVGGDCT